MRVTIRMDFMDPALSCDAVFSNMRRAAVIECFEKLSQDKENDTDDMALILQVDGADIAVKCAHIEMMGASHDVELF